MNLKTNAWYVRWFFWSLGIVDAFFGQERYRLSQEYVERNGTNLCFFVQCNLLYAPLILALNTATCLGALAVLTAAPIYFFGFITYLWILGVIGVIILAIYLVVKLIGYWVDRPVEVKETEQNPGFGSVLWAWLAAKKQKVCPVIKFSDSQEEAR